MSFHARWGPDPNTIYLDVFSITWETNFFYALPPFSLIAHCLHKIARAEHIEHIMIVACVQCALKSHVRPQCGDGIEFEN